MIYSLVERCTWHDEQIPTSRALKRKLLLVCVIREMINIHLKQQNKGY